MNEENDLLWKKVLGEIETEVSRANYLTLFKATALLSLENNTASIAAPSTMVIDLLQKRFYQIIKKYWILCNWNNTYRYGYFTIFSINIK